MILKLFNYSLIFLLLQSCSGGRIGNFLELSFRNIEEEELISNQNNSKSEKVIINKNNFKDFNKPVLSKTKEDFSKSANKNNIQSNQNFKNDEIINSSKNVIKKNIIQEKNKKIKNNYDPQSYRVIIILKSVDPTAPSQKFSNVLKNSNILFEIEKIERFQENEFKKLK